MLSPEDTLEMLQLLTTLDQRMKLRQDLLHEKRSKKVSSIDILMTQHVILLLAYYML